ncbi:MAG: protein kinase [Nitrospinota bacterium]
MTQSIPKRVGKYEVIKKIGKGSMGIVYLGFDPYINRLVAIKVALSHLLKSRNDEKRFRKLFFNEARVAGMLDHTNILPIYDAGIDGKKYYIVMEYVHDGRTLVEYCKVENLLPVKRVLEIIFKCSKDLVVLGSGDCFGKMGYISKEKRTASIFSLVDVTLLQVNSTLIEQASQGCQLRFNKVFLKTLIERLSRTSKNLSKSEQV